MAHLFCVKILCISPFGFEFCGFDCDCLSSEKAEEEKIKRRGRNLLFFFF